MATLLSQADLDRLLAGLDGWQQRANEITRTFTLPSFPAALMFASAVGQLAERADHHPDILISYRKVTLTLFDAFGRRVDREGFQPGGPDQCYRVTTSVR